MLWLRKTYRSDNPSGTLLVSSGGLGDTILFSFVVDRFKMLATPGENVTLVLPKESIKVSFLFDREIRILPVDYKAFRKDRAYVKQITKQFYEANFRLVISTDFLRHPMLDERIIKCCDAQEVVAMEARPWRKYEKSLKKNRALYTQLFNSGPVHLDKILRWSKFADWLSGVQMPPPQLRLPDGRVNPGRDFSKPTVVLVPFSAVKEKQSVPQAFADIIKHLKGRYDFLVATTERDIEANPEYGNIFHKAGISIDKSSFEDLAPKIKNANLVVSVDTATMHLAVSLGVPTICIASAAYVNEIVPYAPEITPDNVRFIYQPMHCQGCLGSCHLELEFERFPCMARIKTDQILNTIDEFLNK